MKFKSLLFWNWKFSKMIVSVSLSCRLVKFICSPQLSEFLRITFFVERLSLKFWRWLLRPQKLPWFFYDDDMVETEHSWVSTTPPYRSMNDSMILCKRVSRKVIIKKKIFEILQHARENSAPDKELPQQCNIEIRKKVERRKTFSNQSKGKKREVSVTAPMLKEGRMLE